MLSVCLSWSQLMKGCSLESGIEMKSEELKMAESYF
jgi:hypothetical protein